MEDYVYLIDDSPSPQGEFEDYRAHRHDQSVFSLVRKEYSGTAYVHEDETHREDWNDPWILSKPFHAKRLRW